MNNNYNDRSVTTTMQTIKNWKAAQLWDFKMAANSKTALLFLYIYIYNEDNAYFLIARFTKLFTS